MKSIEKLRQFIEDQFGSERFAIHSYGYVQGMAIAKLIEEEIADSYMLLPVDADGVPIHVGDICEMNGERFEVRQLHTNGYCWWTIDRLCKVHTAELCHHAKPRTLEDVLVDMLEAAVGYSDAHTDVSLVAVEKYADEIRELLGGDAE